MARSFLLLVVGILLVAATTCNPQVEANGEQLHFVLVPGIEHGAWCWYEITTLLQQAGHRVTALDLTSNGISKVVADTVTSIAQYVHPLIEFLANDVQSPNKVILVGHSLGGSSISYAMELFPEKIDKAIFLAAFMPTNNQTFIPAYVLKGLETLIEQGVFVLNFSNGDSMPATSFYVNRTFIQDFFYNESPLKDVNLGKSLLNPAPFAPIMEVLNLTTTNYGSIERFYIRTDLDHAIPPAFQLSAIQQNPPNQVFFIPKSDHSPFFSMPNNLTRILLSIASS